MEARRGLPVGPVLAALILVAASTALSAFMYLNRGTIRIFSGQQLNNHYAYSQDLIVAPLVLVMLAALLLWRPPGLRIAPGKHVAAGTMAAILLGCWAGTHLVFHNFGLSMDEFLADFDARILRGGHLFAPIPPEWRSMADALQPTFLFRTADASLWSSTYLPGNAAIRAFLGPLSGPALAAAAAGLTYAVARKLQPDDRGFAIAALLLLATSAQFLITAMTPYAMTAHLALNMAWLWLVLHDRPWSRATALAAGFLACGLHQMVFHPLFVAPFLPWLWFSGKRWQALLYALATATFALFWMGYWSIALDLVARGQEAAGLLHVPLADRIEALFKAAMRPSAFAHSGDNLLRMLTWQNPLLWVALAAALLRPRRLPGIGWVLLGGVLLTVAATLLLMPAQGHGWGYRYLHGLLGSLALLGAYGWKRIRERTPAAESRLVVSAAASLLVLLPLRGWQASEFVRPWREADAAIAKIDAEVVLIEHRGRWFAHDLVRNDPHLTNRPLRLLAGRLSAQDAAHLCQTGRVTIIGPRSPELARLRPDSGSVALLAAARSEERLRALGCP